MASGWDANGAAVEMKLAERRPHNTTNTPQCISMTDQQAAGSLEKYRDRTA